MPLQVTASTKDKFNTLWGFLHPCHASPHPLSGPPSSLPPYPLIPSQPSGDIYCPRWAGWAGWAGRAGQGVAAQRSREGRAGAQRGDTGDNSGLESGGGHQAGRDEKWVNTS